MCAGLAHESNGRAAVQASVATPAGVITADQDAEELRQQLDEDSDGPPQVRLRTWQITH